MLATASTAGPMPNVVRIGPPESPFPAEIAIVSSSVGTLGNAL